MVLNGILPHLHRLLRQTDVNSNPGSQGNQGNVLMAIDLKNTDQHTNNSLFSKIWF